MNNNTKKVVGVGIPEIENFHGYSLINFDPLEYFKSKKKIDFEKIIKFGFSRSSRIKLLQYADGIDQLYRDKDPDYMKMVWDFVNKFQEFDIIIMSMANFIHPEIIHKHLKKPKKILAFVDDPYSTYTRGIPYLWAFDGMYYISPSYIDEPFSDAISRWTTKPTKWHPHVPLSYKVPDNPPIEFFSKRTIELAYVGGAYGSKVDVLIQLKKSFGNRFEVYGRWPLAGYMGLARGVFGKPIFPYKVTSLSDNELSDLYYNTKIGFNMHLSKESRECGNMRTYMSIAHGMMMISDKSAADQQNTIFSSGIEAVYYDNINEAIELINYYLENDEARLKIAKAGFDRYKKEYTWDKVFLELLNWAIKV